jgi:hypothetical protein
LKRGRRFGPASICRGERATGSFVAKKFLAIYAITVIRFPVNQLVMASEARPSKGADSRDPLDRRASLAMTETELFTRKRYDKPKHDDRSV